MAIEVLLTKTGLHLQLDSTAIKLLGEGEWKTRKHGTDYQPNGAVYHGIDAAILQICAMEMTDNSIGDAPLLPNLLGSDSAGRATRYRQRRRRLR